MGEFGENCKVSNMLHKILFLSAVAIAAIGAAPAAQKTGDGLPVLFKFDHGTHNVAVYRGADLKKAIAAGLVQGFGNLGQEDRDGRSDDDGGDGDDSYAAPPTTTLAPPPPPTYATTTTPPPPPPPTTTEAYVAPETVAPTYSTPAPEVYKPATKIVYKPAPSTVVYKPAPAQYVSYKPAPAYKATSSYVEPSYADVPAVYTWEYAVKDDYTSNDFGAKESRDGYLTNGKYYVALPDGRLQTVTYTVDGGNGYVPVVEYNGEAQYPDAPAPSYSL